MALLGHQGVFVDIEMEFEALRQILLFEAFDFAFAVDDAVNVALDDLVEVDGALLPQLLAAERHHRVRKTAAVLQRKRRQLHGQIMFQHQTADLGQESHAGVALEHDATAHALP